MTDTNTDNVATLKLVTGITYKSELLSLYGQAVALYAEVERLTALVDDEFKAIPPHLHGCIMHADAEERVIDFDDAALSASDLVDKLAELAFGKGA